MAMTTSLEVESGAVVIVTGAAEVKSGRNTMRLWSRGCGGVGRPRDGGIIDGCKAERSFFFYLVVRRKLKWIGEDWSDIFGFFL